MLTVSLSKLEVEQTEDSVVKPGSKINIHTEGSGSPASMYIVCVTDLERANIRWSLCSMDTFSSVSHITAWKEQTLRNYKNNNPKTAYFSVSSISWAG